MTDANLAGRRAIMAYISPATAAASAAATLADKKQEKRREIFASNKTETKRYFQAINKSRFAFSLAAQHGDKCGRADGQWSCRLAGNCPQFRSQREKEKKREREGGQKCERATGNKI